MVPTLIWHPLRTYFLNHDSPVLVSSILIVGISALLKYHFSFLLDPFSYHSWIGTSPLAFLNISFQLFDGFNFPPVWWWCKFPYNIFNKVLTFFIFPFLYIIVKFIYFYSWVFGKLRLQYIYFQSHVYCCCILLGFTSQWMHYTRKFTTLFSFLSTVCFSYQKLYKKKKNWKIFVF